ncbi:hypothetical protein GDO81_020121 [Engystomops pustulosus]|uniref:H15 domain-containing protein n=2 Tax=Engystomops pustulosus TaxID=76066 RepID=A0AAV6ZAA6_ENGPU|nr:hypothetical protein GDO81_020121 [Engystomops pustulosus]
MAPKKVAAAASAPEKGQEQVPAAETKAKPKMAKPKLLGHPSTLSMVVEALKTSERKGTSVQAIRTRILAAHPTVDAVRLKFHLRSALNKGIEKGILIRPPNSSSTGATGRFKLAKPGAKSKAGGEDKMSENVDPNVQPKEKTKEKPKKKVPKKPKAEKGEAKDEDVEKEKAKGKEKAPEVKAAAAKPKKGAGEKTSKAPAPAKKPKAKAPAAEEEAKPKKEKAKKKTAEPQEENPEEKPAAKSSKKGKK